jgi:hypothetical protein
MSPDFKIWLLAIMKVVALAAILDFKMAAIFGLLLINRLSKYVQT